MDELPFARPRLLVFYCRLIVLAWIGLTLPIPSLLLSKFFGFPVWGMSGYLLLVPAVAGAFTVAPFLRCPHCRRRVTIQTFSPVHPASDSNGTFAGWGGVIVRVIRSRRFVCIHCGEKVSVGPE